MKRSVLLFVVLGMVVTLLACSVTEKQPLSTEAVFLAAKYVYGSGQKVNEATPAPAVATSRTPLPTIETNGAAKGSISSEFHDGFAWFKDAYGKYGYIDTKGNIVIPAKYEAAFNFNNGLAVVSYSDRGALHDIIVDKEGKTVFRNMDSGSVYIDFQQNFDKDVFPVVEIYKATVRNNKYQQIDEQGFNYLQADGKLLTKDKFLYVGGFVDGFAKVGTGKLPKKGIATSSGISQNPPCLKYVTFSGNKSSDVATVFYHIRQDGTRLEKANYDDVGDFSDGYAAVAKYDVKGTLKWGYVDTTGTLIIPTEWSSASAFTNGLAIVSKNGKYGVIDTTGTLVVPLSFDGMRSFSDGFALIRSNDKWGYMDKLGNVVIPAEWDYAYPFSNGRAIVEKKVGEDQVATVIDQNGAVVFSKTYASLVQVNDSYYVFRETKNGPSGLMKADEKIIVEPTWDWIGALGDESMLIRVKQGSKFGLINWQGDIIREPELDSIGVPNDGVSIVKKNGFWFIMDSQTGEILF